MTDAAWANLPHLVEALALLVGACGTFLGVIYARRAATQAKAVEDKTDAQTEKLDTIESKTDAQTQTLEKTAAQTDGNVSKLQAQLDTMTANYQALAARIADIAETAATKPVPVSAPGGRRVDDGPVKGAPPPAAVPRDG